MTDEEKQLYRELRMELEWSKATDKFTIQFRPHQSKEENARQLIEEAIAARDADEVEISLSIVRNLGHFQQHRALFIELFQQQWHHRHEDMIQDLERFGAETQIIESLEWATEIRLKYLEYDDSDALARKAIYVLGRMNTVESRNILNCIAKNSTGVRREWALARLERGNFP